MPRFVLLFHECPPEYERTSHWDLMLERGTTLRTWALAELPRSWRAAHDRTARAKSKCPPLAATDLVAAEQLADHRIAYLEFEGPLSAGRGEVVRIDAGTYDIVSQSAQAPRRCLIEVFGDLLHGTVALSQSESDSQRWMLSASESI